MSKTTVIANSGYRIVFDDTTRSAAAFLAQRLAMSGTTDTTRMLEFLLVIDPALASQRAYEVTSDNGTQVLLRGGTLPLLFAAITYYLREYLHWELFWGHERIDRMTSLPAPSSLHGKHSLPDHLLYFNVCTFGYSTAWWDTARWQYEFDWMTAHGVTMPLAMMGQEYIWQQVWRDLGVKNLDDYFTGPAFLPWNRMGNVNGIAGPLPNDWIDDERRRQHFFLEAARQRGMTPVLPGFAGFVPPQLRALYPDSRFTEHRWCGFAPTLKIDPFDPLALEIGTRFYTALINEYGTDHYYLADAFNEITPPADIPPEEYADSAGRAIYNAMAAVDPQAVWVMQSWQFLGHRDYWQPAVVEAFLSGVPRKQVLIIDMACEFTSVEQWRFYQGFGGRPWLWTVLENGGAIPPLVGNHDDLLNTWRGARQAPEAASNVGAGVCSEGIELNPLFFELAFDLFQDHYPGTMTAWLTDYARRRYGLTGDAMIPALQELLQGVYGPANRGFHSGWGYFSVYHALPVVPGDADQRTGLPLVIVPAAENDPAFAGASWRAACLPSDMQTYRERNLTGSLRRALELALSATENLGDEPLYRHDLVDIARQCVSDHIDKLFVHFLDMRNSGAAAEMEALRQHIGLLMQAQLSVLSSHRAFHLAPWVRNAEAMAHTEEHRRLYRFNAKDQVLRWGDTMLHDYAKKDWAELVRDIYTPRLDWYLQMCIEAVQQGLPVDIKTYYQRVDRLEKEWEQADSALLDGPVGDPITACRHALAMVEKELCER